MYNLYIILIVYNTLGAWELICKNGEIELLPMTTDEECLPKILETLILKI